MNVLIAVTFGLAVTVAVAQNRRPCQMNRDNNAFNKFLNRHILQKDFDRRSDSAWKRYLRKHRLCDRPHQSFISKNDQSQVLRICDGHGRPLKNSYQGNLCMSDSSMLVYDVWVSRDGRCNIRRNPPRRKRVIVACDRVGNRCLPVHYQRNIGQQPDRNAKPCSPRNY